MKEQYVLVVNNIMEEHVYGDACSVKNEVFQTLKEDIEKRNRIKTSYFICQLPDETEEELAAKGGQCGDLIDILDYSKLVETINDMMDTYDTIGIMQTSIGVLVYGREDENGEDKDIYLVEKNGGFVRE